jgi:hypothetical protein
MPDRLSRLIARTENSDILYRSRKGIHQWKIIAQGIHGPLDASINHSSVLLLFLWVDKHLPKKQMCYVQIQFEHDVSILRNAHLLNGSVFDEFH